MGSSKTDEVLQAEAAELFGKNFTGQTGQRLYRSYNAENPAALCISGGGIRSAAFALGVIQALATHPRRSAEGSASNPKSSLLANFHYLSTVSGGGYIGSWLTSWIKRAGWPGVWCNLVGRPGGPDAEPPTLSWLRDHSGYLTPKMGLTSADTWSTAIIVIRNIILNWLIIIPVLCFAIILFKWFAGSVEAVAKIVDGNCLLFASGSLGAACLIFALQFTIRNRPTQKDSRANQKYFLWLDLLPAMASGLLFTYILALPSTHIFFRNLPFCASDSDLASTSCLGMFSSIGGLAGLAIYSIGWIIAWLPLVRRVHLWDLVAWTIAGAVYGSLVAVGVWLYSNQFVHPFWIFKSSEIILIIFALPWALLSQLIAEMIFVGLSSREANSDSDREWFARAAGWYLVAALSWLVLMILIFIGSDLATLLFGNFKTWLAPLGGISGLVTAVLGKSRATPAQGQAKSLGGISANLALAIAAPIFAGILIITASAIIDKVAFGMPLTETKFWKAPVLDINQSFLFPSEGYWLLLWTALFGVVGWGAGFFVNVNRFSLHALYRNRIIRAFLGGSNTTRSANPFTDFDNGDNFRMAELWPRGDAAIPRPMIQSETWRPFHIVNIALNIVSSKKLAWQQRKAESFTASPLHSGSACLNPNASEVRVGGFRDSQTYGDDLGLSLGTAVAISGAAVSPSMGYHSSGPVAFLLTLFNARLGWWLGNPGPQGEKTYKLDGPRIAFLPLLYEMFGLTTDDKKYVYLSDGGHFENLALYEMVRRRCRYIVVIDAGCDPKFEFEDLGNAIRKISLDLGITIRIPEIRRLKRRAEDDRLNPGEPIFHAIGIIDYPAADGEESQPGIMLYIKPFYLDAAIKNVGVRNYAAAHLDFPHQDTANQWFDEPQFESYRALGFEITDTVLVGAITALQNIDEVTLEHVLSKLAERQLQE